MQLLDSLLLKRLIDETRRAICHYVIDALLPDHVQRDPHVNHIGGPFLRSFCTRCLVLVNSLCSCAALRFDRESSCG